MLWLKNLPYYPAWACSPPPSRRRHRTCRGRWWRRRWRWLGRTRNLKIIRIGYFSGVLLQKSGHRLYSLCCIYIIWYLNSSAYLIWVGEGPLIVKRRSLAVCLCLPLPPQPASCASTSSGHGAGASKICPAWCRYARGAGRDLKCNGNNLIHVEFQENMMVVTSEVVWLRF